MVNGILAVAAIGATIVALVSAIGAWRDREDNERLHLLAASRKSDLDATRARLAAVEQSLDEIMASACAMTQPELPARPPRDRVDVALNLGPFDPGWVESANVRVTS